MFGANTTTATWPMFSRFKARSRNKSPVNCAQSFHRKRKRRLRATYRRPESLCALFRGESDWGVGRSAAKKIYFAKVALLRAGDRTRSRSLPSPGAPWQNYKPISLNLRNREAHLAAAKKAAETAAQLRPDPGPVALGAGYYYQSNPAERERRLQELSIARRTLPNDARCSSDLELTSIAPESLGRFAGGITKRPTRSILSTRKSKYRPL